ncbi:MAG: hypothetical protein OEM51_13960, partial [Gammaproteobacteria bacterium]|nr:hypothetical protein [Gammaproteobacteria bacterium]
MSADRQQEAGASARYIDPQRMVREAKAGFWPDKTIVDFFDASLASRPDDEFLVSYRSDAADPVSLS